VIAGRQPPSRWLTDPGWRELLRVVSLRNLRPDETRDYLRVEGVPERMHDQVVAMSHGHPLTLSMLVDAVGGRHGRGRELPEALADAPDVVWALLTRVIDDVPSARHRQALEVCAHARFTTEELLRFALEGDDSHELFGWLRTLSFVEEAPQGLYPHDVARDVLDADLRWRDAGAYADLHRRLRRYMVDRVRQAPGPGLERQDRLGDIVFLSRIHDVTAAYYDLAGMGHAYVDPLRPADRPTVLAMTERFQGAEQAALAEYWMGRQPEGFRLFRDTSGEAIGYGAYLVLHELGEPDLRTGRCSTTTTTTSRRARISRSAGRRTTCTRTTGGGSASTSGWS
jgi:hypothetical protein